MLDRLLLVSRSVNSAISSADLHALVHSKSRSLGLVLQPKFCSWIQLVKLLAEDTFLQAAARLDNQEDGFAPPSPKKVVTKATQRRRTADEQAREEKFHRDLAHPNAFAALADDGGSHGQATVASSENRLVPLSRLDAAYLYCILR